MENSSHSKAQRSTLDAPANRAWLYLFISSQRELFKSYTWHTFGGSSRNSARHHCLCDIRKCYHGTCLLDMCKIYAACRTDTATLPALTCQSTCFKPRVPSVRSCSDFIFCFCSAPIKTQIWSTVTTRVDMTLCYSVSGIWRFLNCTQRNECAVILVTNSGKAFPEVEITNSWLLVSCSCHKIPACAFWD